MSEAQHFESKQTLLHERARQPASASVSQQIHARLRRANKRAFANDNISEFVRQGELDGLLDEVQQHAMNLLRALVIDIDNDHNTEATARRIAKMWISEVFGGRYVARPKLVTFPNSKNVTDMLVVGPIEIRSTCAHHLQPIRGSCWIGIYPGDVLIGLSKFNRIVDWVVSRPQIQEEMTEQIVDEIHAATGARGVIATVASEHFCLKHRGVRSQQGIMSTVAKRGRFEQESAACEEFLQRTRMVSDR